MASIPKLTTLLQQQEFLQCPVCDKNIQDPVILPCLDTVCGSCYGNSQQEQESDGPLSPMCKSNVKDQDLKNGQHNHFMRFLREFADCVNEDVQKNCDYCAYDKNSSPASERCLQCNDNLCDVCAEAHRRTKLTRNHQMATFTQIHNGKFDSELRALQHITCATHSTEPLRYLCNKCDQLLCRECKVSRHDNHSCTEISQACQRYKNNTKTMLDKVKQKIPTLENYSDFLHDYHTHVETSKVEAVRSIEYQASMLHKAVDQYRQSLIDKIMPEVISEQAKIESQQKKLNKQIDDLSSSVDYIDTLFEHGKDDEILDNRQIITRRLTELAYTQPDTMTTKLSIRFREGKQVAQANENAFGNAEVLHVPLNKDNVKSISKDETFDLSTAMPMFGESVKLVHEFECKGQNDSKDIWPSGIAIDITGNILIVDRENKCVKVFDKEGILVREFGFSGSGTLVTPYDLAVLHNGNIAVTDYEDECVKIYNHTGDFVTSWKKGFKYPRGITTNKSKQVLVVDSNLHRVTIHDPDTGSIQGEIKGKTPDKCDLFNDPYYITTNSNGYTIVTDWVAPNIKLFDTEGKYLSKYGTYGVSRDRLLQPYGACSDHFGYIFVADNHNHRIHLLGPDGKFIRFLLHEKHGIWHPMAITINDDGHLVVTEALGKVKIFKYI